MAALPTSEFNPSSSLSFSGDTAFSADDLLPPEGASSPDRLIFVDASLAQLDTLTQSLASEEIVFIEAHEDGVQKIADVLSTRQDLLSVHILGHGSSGAVSLGNSTLSRETLAEYERELQTWGTALLGKGDLFFYGCDVAAGKQGVEFIEDIAAATQADVAASDDTTGHASLGGDWALEVTTGDVSAALSLEAYHGVLPTYQGNTYQLTSAGSWEAAQAQAESLGGNLVAINNGAEQVWLNETFGTSERLWIGLSDRTSEGTFVWENGDTSTYRNWAPGEPNDYRNGVGFESGEDYALKNWQGNGQWNDTPNTLRGQTFRGIVEIEGVDSGAGGGGVGERLEAEAATLANGAKKNNNHAGFSDSGFVDGYWNQGASTTFDVTVADAGSYLADLRYGNGLGNVRSLSLYVNGTDVTQAKFDPTGGWAKWGNDTETIQLQAGSNTIEYRYDASDNGIINLDYLTVTKTGGNPNPPDPTPPSGSPNASAKRIEAESAQLTGGAATNTNHAGFSGSSFVDKFTNKGAAVTFTVNTDTAGSYNTTLRYANGPFGASNNGTKDLSLYVNGVEIKDTNLAATGAWNKWKNKTEVLNLKKGANTITYQHNNDNNGVVNLDYIWLSKEVGNGPIDVPINDFGLGLTVKKIAQLPKDSTGKNARMIGMTTQGQRTFVYEERDGHIYDISGSTNSTRNPSLFFDVGAAVKTNTGRNLNTNNVTHGGLKGVAFHPNFTSNGKFYTAIMEDRPSNAAAFDYLSDAANPIGADAVVVEWTYDFSNNTVINNSY
ncbi:MAG: DUF4347 domain-containing protein, partial [Cyanobacteria bacterium J06632_3]